MATQSGWACHLLILGLVCWTLGSASAVEHCTSDDQCNGHACAASSNNTCDCGSYYEPPFCAVSYDDIIGHAVFTVYRVFVGLLHATVVLISCFSLGVRLHRKGIRRANLRDGVMATNAAACFLRVLWVLDPIGSDNLYVSISISDVLLRIPQILWIMCMLIVINVWIMLINEKIPRWALIASVASMVVLCGVGIPITILRSFKRTNYFASQVGNLLFLLYVVALSVGGCIFARRLHSLLATYKMELERRMGSDDGGESATRLRRVSFLMVNIRRTVIVASIIGWQMLLVNIVVAAARIRPTTRPWLYMVFLLDVHIVSEGGFSLLILWTGWQPLRESQENRQKSARLTSQPRSRGSGGRSSRHSHESGPRDVTNPLHDVELAPVDSPPAF